MNLAVGFSCPVCGREDADVLRLELNQVGYPTSIRLHCSSCEAVFVETLQNEETERAHLAPARFGPTRGIR